MKKRTNRLNQFGMDVAIFCLRHNLEKQELAALAGVDASSIKKVGTGVRSGVTVIPLVRAAMEAYARDHESVNYSECGES